MIRFNKKKFETCNIKNNELDKKLSDKKDSKPFDIPKLPISLKDLTRRGQPGAFDNYKVKTVNLQYPTPHAHSVIFVKHPGITKYDFAIS